MIIISGPTILSKFDLVDRGDPASVDFATGDITANGAAHDLDLSGKIPVGAYAVLLEVGIRSDTANKEIQFRKKGNSNWHNTFRVHENIVNLTSFGQGWVFCDANRVIEYMASDITFSILDVTVCAWVIK